MDRPKRPPPLPKFEDQKDQNALEQKLNSFISSLAPAEAEAKDPHQARKDVKAPETKKKVNLANINSKLNSMLSAKKINIGTLMPADAQKQKEDREEKTKRPEPDYDPQHPNNYEVSKLLFLEKLEAQREQHIEFVPEQQQQPQESPEQSEQKEQIALRMMQKFGYKVGEGLGKQGQGIRTPLIVRKTNDSAGVIQQSSIPLNHLIPPEIAAKNALSAHNVEAEKCIAILGVGKDQEMIKDVRQECERVGTVIEWMSIANQDEHRIFVQFSSKEEAMKAFILMNGKYLCEDFISVRFVSPQKLQSDGPACSLHCHITT